MFHYSTVRSKQSGSKAASALLIVCLVLTLMPLVPAPAAMAEDSESVQTAPNSTIETGDALAAGALTTTENLTIIETTNPEETSPAADAETLLDTASTTNASPEAALAASATLAATTTNSATTTAMTGVNIASSTSTTTIDTGDAIAYIDVTNVVNTTITDSTGLIRFVNDMLDVENFDIQNDLISIFDGGTTAVSTPDCLPVSCGELTSSSIDSDAVIMNNIVVAADTGGNSVSGDSATIWTGDAYASANVVNVANTNITDSSYLLLVFNNFSDYSGDIVLPASDFFDQFVSPQGSSGSGSTDNSATVGTDLSVAANSGDNSATGSSTMVTTGTATALGTVHNVVNQNFLNTGSFSMLIRVYGDWSGEIFGLPDGMSWEETPEGIRLYAGGGGSGASGSYTTAHNSATINNAVQVYALTGNNHAVGTNAAVHTGNAYAGASIMNLINTNIIGSNWASLIFSIYGNWSGNLSFGRSDLWLGVRADSPDAPIMPGSPVTYTYTVMNRGNLSATNVTLDASFEPAGLAFDGAGAASTDVAGLRHQTWSLGTIPAGATREFRYAATVNHTLSRRTETLLPLATTVTSRERDANLNDNTDEVVIAVGGGGSGTGGGSHTMPATIAVSKAADHNSAAPGDTIAYTITLDHSGGPVFDAYVADILENEQGSVIEEQFIPLGDLDADELVSVTYTIALGTNMATGTYTNSAQVIGFQGNKNLKRRVPFSSTVATHALRVGVGQVLGLSTCTPYLTTYLRRGSANSTSDVSRLQTFLNSELITTLTVNGLFDEATEAAVRSFQSRYASDILTPWGLSEPTGYVYYTTQRKINERYCGGSATFPFSSAQQQEMQRIALRLRS